MVDIGIADNTNTSLSNFIIAITITCVILSIILIFCYYKLFEKNGEKGWKAFIPIYNMYILMNIASMNPFSLFLLLIPIVNLFVLALLSVNLANKYNKGALFAIGLLFLPFIYYPILAFSKLDLEEQMDFSIKDKEPLASQIKENEMIENIDLKKEQEVPFKANIETREPVSKKEKEEINTPDSFKEISTKEKDEDTLSTLEEFREILKVNNYKEKMKEVESEEDRLEIEQVKDQKQNITAQNKLEDLNKAADDVLKSIKIINKEKAIKEKQEALEDSSICSSCGSVIPRFSKKCLLCGTDAKKE